MFDVDGTLNSETWYKTHKPGNLEGQDNDLDPKCIERLNKICSETGAYLVMSSDWRKNLKINVFYSYFSIIIYKHSSDFGGC